MVKANPTFVCYIDESGDEGFKFEEGSSEWFVLSAVITRKSTDLETVKLVDRVRSLINRPAKKVLHFRKLKHHTRVAYIGEIAKADLKVISILFHKCVLEDRKTFQKPNRLYFYCVRLLLERVSWYCRDSHTPTDEGDGSAQIIFSNRSSMSYEDMKRYLALLKDNPGQIRTTIHWPVLRPQQIVAFSPGKKMGLQIADATAYSYYSAVEKNQYGYTETRYAIMLKPRVYNHKERYLTYGLKFFPVSRDELIERYGFEWLKEYEK